MPFIPEDDDEIRLPPHPAPFIVVQDVVCADRAAHFMIALAASRGAQQFVDEYALRIAQLPERDAGPRGGAGREIAPRRPRGIAEPRIGAFSRCAELRLARNARAALAMRSLP